MRVAVVGAKGRMGSTVVEAVSQAEDLEIVATLDKDNKITTTSINGAEVTVEFTVPEVSEANVKCILEAGSHVVVGTTGWKVDAQERIAKIAQENNRNILIAPNYAIGAVLAMKFARLAAKYFESAEIIELHHPNKLDAPSGTAIATAHEIAQARIEAGIGEPPDATHTDPDGARGAKISGISVHALRIRGVTASEEILFGNPGEQFTIRSDCFARESFMPGVILAVRKVPQLQGFTWGIESLIS